MSWADFEESETHNTKKDLDLLVYDSNGDVVGGSELIQQGEAPPLDQNSNLSSYAREVLSLKNLDRGVYKIRVRNQSANFLQSDRLRVMVVSDQGDSIKFSDATKAYEIMPPADHPEAITVGEDTNWSSKGPTADGRTKPEVKIKDSTIKFSNGTQPRGSSTAAALFAGWVAATMSDKGQFDLGELRDSLSSMRNEIYPSVPQGWRTLELSQISQDAKRIIPLGSTMAVHPTGRLVVYTKKDPLGPPLFKRLQAQRQKSTDLVTYSPMNRDLGIFPADQDNEIPNHYIEFREQTSSLPFLWFD